MGVKAKLGGGYGDARAVHAWGNDERRHSSVLHHPAFGSLIRYGSWHEFSVAAKYVVAGAPHCERRLYAFGDHMRLVLRHKGQDLKSTFNLRADYCKLQIRRRPQEAEM